MKYCRDCRFLNSHASAQVCTSPNLPKDLVTGGIVFALCKDQRYPVFTPSHSQAHCGADGKWFEPKTIEAADFDDLSTIPFGK